ncbi:DUF1592 domain-containing protein [Planctomicrobium sp. SH668]|uniref:DUF1592 domain-containing protein n=1 Tax=Planctomicrobium sp. SH668 TaxID=3448126 RepID=UPI003F5C59CD
MNWRPFPPSFRILLAAGGLFFCPQLALAAPPPEAFPEFNALMAKYCFECHQAEKQEGGLDLTRFQTHEQALADRKFWESVQHRVLPREMPPEGSPQPNDPERDKIRAWLDQMVSHEGECNQVASDQNTNFYRGHVMSRRLTRPEYANSVRDLLGVQIDAVGLLPSDGSGGVGVDSVGDTLYLSPIHLEKYLDAAVIATEALWPDVIPEAEPELITRRREEIGGREIEPENPGRETAQRILAPLIRRAFRRPVPSEELDRYVGLYDHAASQGQSHRAALRFAMQGILLSPHFLFLAEPESETEGTHPLGNHPLAARLAMLIWSSLPDEELLALADAGQLQNDDVLREQTRRMLKDPRAKALGENFAMQWLGLNPLGSTVRPDAEAFPEFTEELADAMLGETSMFVANLFMENRSLVEVLSADYTFLNGPLAKHYGIEGVEGPELRKVNLADPNRGGILTHASVLTVSSYPHRTSPVLRGHWVLSEVMGSRVPPPPPGVPSLEEVSHDGVKRSLREQLEIHRSKPECASCHSRMDPLGFGLENFDAIGRWRQELDGLPIDASGVLPSGESFQTPAELKTILLNRKDDVMRHLIRKMYGYAVGRDLNKFDDCVIQNTLAALQQNNYHSNTMVEEIVLSFPFRHRYYKK